MGFGEIAAQMIFFITIVTAAAAIAVTLNIYSAKTTSSMKIENDKIIDNLKTDIIITSIAYINETDPDRTYVYAKNIGETKLGINSSDVYIDGIRYGSPDRVTTIEPDTDKGSALSWDPGEIIKFEISNNIDEGQHTVKVVTNTGVYDEETFSS